MFVELIAELIIKVNLGVADFIGMKSATCEIVPPVGDAEFDSNRGKLYITLLLPDDSSKMVCTSFNVVLIEG